MAGPIAWLNGSRPHHELHGHEDARGRTLFLPQFLVLVPLGAFIPEASGAERAGAPRRGSAARGTGRWSGQGWAVSVKLCAEEPSQGRWVSWTPFAEELAELRHWPLCRAVKW